MTNHYKVIKLYHSSNQVTIDMLTLDEFERGLREDVLHKYGDEWIAMKPPIQHYYRYVHETSPETKERLGEGRKGR